MSMNDDTEPVYLVEETILTEEPETFPVEERVVELVFKHDCWTYEPISEDPAGEKQ